MQLYRDESMHINNTIIKKNTEIKRIVKHQYKCHKTRNRVRINSIFSCHFVPRRDIKFKKDVRIY